MRHSKLKLLAVVLSVIVVLASLVGCKSTSKSNTTDGSSTSTSTSSSSTSAAGTKSKVADESTAEVTKGKSGEVIKTWAKTTVAPEGFPSDFPMYDATINSASKVEGSNTEGYYVGLETKDDFKTVFAWYKSALSKNGWTVQTSSSSTKNGVSSGVVTTMKDNKQGGVTLLDQNGSVKLAISLNIVNK